MTEQAQNRIWSSIDVSKTLAGALAAVCAAVLGSFLGVAGTLIGAAVASIVGTVGTEVYAWYINRGTKKLQTLAPTFIKAPAAVGTPPVEAAAEEDSPSHTVPAGRGRQLRWGRIALIAGAVFVLAIGSLTVVELLAQRSVASMVGNSSAGTTTIGSVADDSDKQETPTPETSVTPSDEATTPTDAPTSTNPTGDPATTPATEPTTTPTTVAPTEAPQQAPTGGTQQDPPAQEPGTE